MTRFIQSENRPKPKETKPVAKPKPGTYTSQNLQDTKKIPTKGGYQ